MAYVYLAENMRGRSIEFLENEDGNRENTFRMKPYGKTLYGTLALQTFEDRPYKRITFADTANVYVAAVKKALGYGGIIRANNPLLKALKTARMNSRNDLCHFDFSPEELQSGDKLLRIEVQIVGLEAFYGLTAYDFTTRMGVTYLMPDEETASGWGKALGIPRAHLFDEDGKLDSMVDL